MAVAGEGVWSSMTRSSRGRLRSARLAAPVLTPGRVRLGEREVSKMMRCGSVGISRPRRRHARRRSPARFPTGCGRPLGRPSDSARRRPGVHRPGTSTAPRGNKLRSPVMQRPFRQPAGPREARRPSRPAFVSSTSRQVSQQLSGRRSRRRQGRNVGYVGNPQAIRHVGLEAALDPVRRRPVLHLPARRAGPAAPAHPGDARGTHHPRDPLAAGRNAGFGQFGVNPRRAVRAPAVGMNLLHAGRQLRIGPRTSRGWTSTPRVVPARGDTEHTGHRGDAETGLVRAHEPVDLPGPVSRANQAVAFASMSRSSRSRRTSRRSCRTSSRSSVRRPSVRVPVSRSA